MHIDAMQLSEASSDERRWRTRFNVCTFLILQHVLRRSRDSTWKWLFVCRTSTDMVLYVCLTKTFERTALRQTVDTSSNWEEFVIIHQTVAYVRRNVLYTCKKQMQCMLFKCIITWMQTADKHCKIGHNSGPVFSGHEFSSPAFSTTSCGPSVSSCFGAFWFRIFRSCIFSRSTRARVDTYGEHQYTLHSVTPSQRSWVKSHTSPWQIKVNPHAHASSIPSPPLDNIRVIVIVSRLRGNIIRTTLCWIVWHNVHSPQHTYVSTSYRSNRLGLSHWDPCAVRRGGCLELYYCNMVEWFWWDSSLIFHCQLVSFSALTLLVSSSGL